VNETKYWKYSSVRDYEGVDGLIHVDMVFSLYASYNPKVYL